MVQLAFGVKRMIGTSRFPVLIYRYTYKYIPLQLQSIDWLGHSLIGVVVQFAGLKDKVRVEGRN